MVDPAATERIEVEVIFALAEEQHLIRVQMALGTTVRDAITQSGILQRYPEIDLELSKVGIFNRLCGLDQQLKAGDRIEIYRPLKIDPMDKRRKRAKLQRIR